MSFEIPEAVHPDLEPLAWLLGRWAGNGRGDYPTIEEFSFRQEIVFAHDGRPFLHYFSRTFLTEGTAAGPGTVIKPSGIETGFFRARPEGRVEVVLAHPTGFAEIWYGEVDGTKLELATDVVVRTESAKEYTAGKRLYGLVEGHLLWAYDMAAMGQQLQSHLWGRLEPVSDGPDTT
jgi:THAP4-like, heme-binding beta-barrel domain